MKSLISNRRKTNRISVSFQLAAVNEGGSSLASYGYDSDNRLLTLNHAFGSSSTVPSQDFSYAYDSVGDRTSRSETNGSAPANSDSYSYDAIDQVTGVNYGSGRNVGYNYDPVGNRTGLTDSVNGNTSYTSNSLNQYTNVAAQVPQYDTNGNLTGLNGSSYSYDAQNRLLTATAGSNNETIAYDPMNRPVSRTLNGVTTYYLYDGWELIEELDGSGNELANYVSGARADELLTKSNANGTVFYHHDALNSITALTDDNGNLVERYTYDAFGKPSIYDATGSSLTTSAYGNRFLFTGREYLQELGLYDYRFRVYSADLGRFLQTDPMGFAAGDVNIYRYVGNSPINTGDPAGLWYQYQSGDYTAWNALFAAEWNQNKNNFRKNWEQKAECPKEHDVSPIGDPGDPNPGGQLPPGTKLTSLPPLNNSKLLVLLNTPPPKDSVAMDWASGILGIAALHAAADGAPGTAEILAYAGIGLFVESRVFDAFGD